MSDQSVPVVVVDDDQAVRGRLAMQLGERADAGASLEVVAAGLTGRPLVVVLGPSFGDPEALTRVQSQLGAHREVGTVLVVEQLSTQLLQTALRLGVGDVLEAPVEAAALAEAVDRVGAGLAPVPVLADPFVTLPEQAGDRGHVITVFSTKGGAGKSVLAANMAVSLARRCARPVVLVDADLQFGDVAVMLKLAPQHTIVDAVGSLDRLDPALLEQLLVRHEPSGLHILAAPLEPSFADQISVGEMVKIIEMLRGFCAWVVVDTPAYFNEVVLGIIEESDDVLLVAGMDIPNIKNVKIGLQTLRLLGVPMSKLHLILNRANSKVKLDVGEVERTLQVRAEALIPSDVVVPQSVNKGTPVVLDAPRSGVAKSIEALVDRFWSQDEARRR
jgi:pilus assembly protein CpaE